MSLCTEPLETLSYSHCSKKVVHHDSHYMYGYNKGTLALIWFIIIVVIVFFCLFVAKPDWIMRRDAQGNITNEVDAGKAFLWSILISFCIIIVLYVLWWAFKGGW